MSDTRKDDLGRWLQDQQSNGWEMPRAAWWKRLPVIRNFRAAAHGLKVAQNERFWGRIGMIPSGYDRWVLFGIHKGLERPLSNREAGGDG